MVFLSEKTNTFKTKFDPECLNSSWISYWEVLSAPGVNEEIKKIIIFEETNSSSVSNLSFTETPITIIIIFIIKIAP